MDKFAVYILEPLVTRTLHAVYLPLAKAEAEQGGHGETLEARPEDPEVAVGLGVIQRLLPSEAGDQGGPRAQGQGGRTGGGCPWRPGKQESTLRGCSPQPDSPAGEYTPDTSPAKNIDIYSLSNLKSIISDPHLNCLAIEGDPMPGKLVTSGAAPDVELYHHVIPLSQGLPPEPGHLPGAGVEVLSLSISI